MKIVSILLAFATLLFGNEVERIESIVHDVTKLRQNYEACKAELALFDTLKVSKNNEKIVTLQREIESQRDLYEREIERMKNELSASEKKLALMTRSLNDTRAKSYEQKQRIDTQKEKLSRIGRQKSSELKKVYITVDPKPCMEPNPFPELLMKTEYQTMNVNGTLKGDTGKVVSRLETDEVRSSKSIFFKPRPFRMKRTAKVYSTPNGKVIATWEARRSFTSGEKQDGWIRITGYFIDKKWHPNRDTEMWVEEKNTIIR